MSSNVRWCSGKELTRFNNIFKYKKGEVNELNDAKNIMKNEIRLIKI